MRFGKTEPACEGDKISLLPHWEALFEQVPMFCGGFFICKLLNDFFICSDGIEMTQKELLNIVRATISHPNFKASPDFHRVMFVEAASTLL